MMTVVCLNPCLDKTIHVNGFTPGGTNRAVSETLVAGGKGVNVAMTIAKLGVKVRLVIFGYQEGSELLNRTVEELGIECVSVPVPGALRTNIKVMDDTTGIITEINAKGVKVDDDAVQRMEDTIVDCAMDSSWVALTGSMPPGCGADCYANLIRRIHSEAPSCLVALDADGEAFRLGVKENPDFIKPNRAELSTFVGEELDTDEKLQAAARKLVEDGLGCVIVSMDSEGSMLFAEGVEMTAKAVKVPVVTTVGAGDNLVSGYLSGREAGLSHAEAFRRGVATATARVAGEDGQYAKYLDQVTVTDK